MTLIKFAWFRLGAALVVLFVAVSQDTNALGQGNLWRPPSTARPPANYRNPNDGRPHTWLPDAYTPPANLAATGNT